MHKLHIVTSSKT